VKESAELASDLEKLRTEYRQLQEKQLLADETSR
jgi:hypothetical protein